MGRDSVNERERVLVRESEREEVAQTLLAHTASISFLTLYAAAREEKRREDFGFDWMDGWRVGTT